MTITNKNKQFASSMLLSSSFRLFEYTHPGVSILMIWELDVVNDSGNGACYCWIQLRHRLGLGVLCKYFSKATLLMIDF